MSGLIGCRSAATFTSRAGLSSLAGPETPAPNMIPTPSTTSAVILAWQLFTLISSRNDTTVQNAVPPWLRVPSEATRVAQASGAFSGRAEGGSPSERRGDPDL